MVRQAKEFACEVEPHQAEVSCPPSSYPVERRGQQKPCHHPRVRQKLSSRWHACNSPVACASLSGVLTGTGLGREARSSMPAVKGPVTSCCVTVGQETSGSRGENFQTPWSPPQGFICGEGFPGWDPKWWAGLQAWGAHVM